MSNEFGLVEVTIIPEGITPLVFDSVEELENFLVESEKAAKPSQHTTYIEYNPKKPQPGVKSVSYTVVTRSCSSIIAVGTKFNTWADIRVGFSGSSYYTTWIDSVLNTRVGLTGLTMGKDLSNEYSYSYNQTTQSVSVVGGGIFNMYMVVEGGIRVYSRPVSCSFTYSVN